MNPGGELGRCSKRPSATRVVRGWLDAAEYAVPVHADSPPVMDVLFVKEHAPHVNPLGVKGVGEIAVVGVAPAITNAIFHATGRRIRTLPVTPDKLL